MKNNKKLLTVLSTAALSLGFAFAGVATLNASAEATQDSNIAMRGSSIRYEMNEDGEGGIRFVALINKSWYDGVVASNESKEVTTGIKMVPVDVIGKDATFENIDALDSELTVDTTSVMQVYTEADVTYYETKAYVHTIPEHSYNRTIAAVAYVAIDGEVVYYGDVITDSVASVAKKLRAMDSESAHYDELDGYLLDYAVNYYDMDTLLYTDYVTYGETYGEMYAPEWVSGLDYAWTNAGMNVVEGDEKVYGSTNLYLQIDDLTANLFAKHDAGATLSRNVDANGNVVLTYTGTAEWGGRAQFTEYMAEEYFDYMALVDDKYTYDLKVDVQYTTAPSKMQFWYIVDSGMKAATLDEFIANGSVTAVDAQGNEIAGVSDMEKDAWYTLSFHLSNLPELIVKDVDKCLQIASIATLNFKNVAFEKVELKIDYTAIMFEKLSSGATLTKNSDNGVTVMNYKGTSQWDGRIHFTPKMVEYFQAYQADCDLMNTYYLTFELQFVSDPATMQFWQITSTGMNGNPTPTLAGFVSSGIATIKDAQGNSVAGESGMTKGTWYTVSFNIANMIALASSGGNNGLQLGCIGEFNYKNVQFVCEETIITLFKAVSTGAISVTTEGGAFAQRITKSGTQGHWDSRTGMTKTAYDAYIAFLAETGYAMQFDMQYVSGAGNNWQFWNASAEPAPTLSSLVNNGTVTIKDSQGNSVAVADMQNGVTYTITVDIDKMGTCRVNGGQYGWEFGINEASFEMLVSTARFIKKA